MYVVFFIVMDNLYNGNGKTYEYGYNNDSMELGFDGAYKICIIGIRSGYSEEI